MTSGLDANDDDPASPGTEDRLTAQKDRYKFTLDLPMAHAPGEKAVYSAAGINLLGSVLQHATGRWLPDLIQEEFAVPLGIRHYHLPLGASGDAVHGWSSYRSRRSSTRPTAQDVRPPRASSSMRAQSGASSNPV